MSTSSSFHTCVTHVQQLVLQMRSFHNKPFGQEGGPLADTESLESGKNQVGMDTRSSMREAVRLWAAEADDIVDGMEYATEGQK